jgi:hypothetical protein
MYTYKNAGTYTGQYYAIANPRSMISNTLELEAKASAKPLAIGDLQNEFESLTVEKKGNV